jgi:hypothetical protein
MAGTAASIVRVATFSRLGPYGQLVGLVLAAIAALAGSAWVAPSVREEALLRIRAFRLQRSV